VAHDSLSVAVVRVVVLGSVVDALPKRIVVRDRHWVLPVVVSMLVLVLD